NGPVHERAVLHVAMKDHVLAAQELLAKLDHPLGAGWDFAHRAILPARVVVDAAAAVPLCPPDGSSGSSPSQRAPTSTSRSLALSRSRSMVSRRLAQPPAGPPASTGRNAPLSGTYRIGPSAGTWTSSEPCSWRASMT